MDEHCAWLASREGLAFSQRLTAAADRDPLVLGYVHWTFPDQTVEDQYPSFMMVRPGDPLGESPCRRRRRRFVFVYFCF
jgi:hypothetical protein